MLTRQELYEIAMSNRVRWDGEQLIGFEQSLVEELGDDERKRLYEFMLGLGYEVWYQIKYGAPPPYAKIN